MEILFENTAHLPSRATEWECILHLTAGGFPFITKRRKKEKNCSHGEKMR